MPKANDHAFSSAWAGTTLAGANRKFPHSCAMVHPSAHLGHGCTRGHHWLSSMPPRTNTLYTHKSKAAVWVHPPVSVL